MKINEGNYFCSGFNQIKKQNKTCTLRIKGALCTESKGPQHQALLILSVKILFYDICPSFCVSNYKFAMTLCDRSTYHNNTTH